MEKHKITAEQVIESLYKRHYITLHSSDGAGSNKKICITVTPSTYPFLEVFDHGKSVGTFTKKQVVLAVEKYNSLK